MIFDVFVFRLKRFIHSLLPLLKTWCTGMIGTRSAFSWLIKTTAPDCPPSPLFYPALWIWRQVFIVILSVDVVLNSHKKKSSFDAYSFVFNVTEAAAGSICSADLLFNYWLMGSRCFRTAYVKEVTRVRIRRIKVTSALSCAWVNPIKADPASALMVWNLAKMPTVVTPASAQMNSHP